MFNVDVSTGRSGIQSRWCVLDASLRIAYLRVPPHKKQRGTFVPSGIFTLVFHFLYHACSRTGLVSGNWDIKPYNEKSPLDESEADSNVVRGRWNADTKAVFLDEYDDEGNVTTAKINGFVSFEKQTLVRFFGMHFGDYVNILSFELFVHFTRLGTLREFF